MFNILISRIVVVIKRGLSPVVQFSITMVVGIFMIACKQNINIETKYISKLVKGTESIEINGRPVYAGNSNQYNLSKTKRYSLEFVVNTQLVSPSEITVADIHIASTEPETRSLQSFLNSPIRKGFNCEKERCNAKILLDNLALSDQNYKISLSYSIRYASDAIREGFIEGDLKKTTK